MYNDEDYFDEDCPCDTCSQQPYCDGWEARFYLGGGDCDNCDPMDI